MKLLLFKIKLLILLGFFLVRLVANVSNKTKPAMLAVFLILLVSIVLLVTTKTRVQPEENKQIPPTLSPKYTDQFELKTLSEEEIHQEIEKWIALSEKQPKSRDVLLNISFLYSTLGDEKRSLLYLEKAKLIAPNHILLQ